MIFSYQVIERVAREQSKDLQRQAEKMRLTQLLRLQTEKRRRFQAVTRWLGVQMVKWGLRLQGNSMASSSQISAQQVSGPNCLIR
jgi:hypothetical protein